jgi:chromosome partitioning protein
VIVTLLNQKGGVGKTSTCHHVGGALARSGRRVLLVDNDPQASLTQGFFGPDAARSIDPARTAAALYDPRTAPDPAQAVVTTGIAGLDLVPGSRAAAAWNVPPEFAPGRAGTGMAEFLAEASEGYDLVLIDCPPNLLLCSLAALAASGGIVVPVQPEDYGAQGLAPVQEAVDSVRASSNPALRLLGYLISMYDKRLGIHLTYEAVLREAYGAEVFANPVPLAKDFKEAVAARLPVSHYKPKSAAAKAAAAVGEELMARCAGDAAAERSAA